MNNVFFCNNAFQFLVVCRIILENYKCENNKLYLSDDINGYETLEQISKHTKLFETINVLKVKKCISQRRDVLFKIKRAKCEFCMCPYIFNKKRIDSNIDRVFLNGPRCYVENYVRLLRKNKSELEINLYEEGYSSYTKLYRDALFKHGLSEKIIRIISTPILGRHVNQLIKNYYLFDPDLLCWKTKYNVKKISKNIKDNEFINILGYNKLYSESLNRKNFIFLEEAFWVDYNENDDLWIIDMLYNQLGFKDIVIRLHPRSTYNRFEKYGYQIMEKNDIPWEILLTTIYRDNILITMSSGAAISSRLLFSLDNKIILLYKCVKNAHMNESSVQEWFNKFTTKYKNNLYIPSTTNELRGIITNTKWKQNI